MFFSVKHSVLSQPYWIYGCRTMLTHLKSKSSFARYFEALVPEMWQSASCLLQHGPVFWSLTAIIHYCTFISLGWQVRVLVCGGTLLPVLLLIYPAPVIMAEKESQSVMSPSSPLRPTNPWMKKELSLKIENLTRCNN